MSARTATITALSELLQNGDEADRCYAARALGSMRAEDAVEALIQCLGDEDIDVCVDAAGALGRIGSSRAAPALIESLENDTSGEICTAVAGALGNIGGEEAAKALRRIALERPEALEWDDDWDTWWDVQLEAVRGLGRFQDQAAVDLMVSILEDESHQDIESEILSALGRIQGKGTEVLIERLQDKSLWPQQRQRAARALGRVEATAQIEQVLGRALQDDAPDVRAAAATALGEQSASRYLRAMLLLLRDQEEEVRKAALGALTILVGSEMSDPNLEGEILPLLQDPSSQVRLALFTTLRRSRDNISLSEEALDAVVDSLGDESAETAAAACELLGFNGDHRALPQLLRVLDEPDGHPMVRREAALSIGRLGRFDEAVADSLGRGVRDPNQAVRQAVLGALLELDVSDGVGSEVEQTPLTILLDTLQGASKDEPPAPDVETTADGSEVGEDGAAATFDEAGVSESEGPATEQPMTLPDTPSQIVQAGEVRSARSTLDAIAMDQVEATLESSAPPEEPEHDATTREYLQVVEENKETMARIRSERKVDPARDVRRLAARTLAESDREEAVQALIQALGDEDPLLRREAAEAVGRMAQRGLTHPSLMDAVGILITQLAVGDLDQRLASARALGYLGNRAGLIPLLESLKDDHPNVRIQAIEALAWLDAHGADPDLAGHMVVSNLSLASLVRRQLDCLDDSEMGVRVCAARNLAGAVNRSGDKALAKRVVAKIIDSVSQFTGEEARLIGQALREYDLSLSVDKLLADLTQADDSVKRSVVIEMLEELLLVDAREPDQAA